MVFEGSGEVRTGIEEACNSCVVLGEELDEEVEIQTLMKGHSCYTTCDNSEVTLRHVVVVVTVSTYTHQPRIHKYCDFHYWWTAMVWYLTDQEKSGRVLKKLATHALC